MLGNLSVIGPTRQHSGLRLTVLVLNIKSLLKGYLQETNSRICEIASRQPQFLKIINLKIRDGGIELKLQTSPNKLICCSHIFYCVRVPEGGRGRPTFRKTYNHANTALGKQSDCNDRIGTFSPEFSDLQKAVSQAVKQKIKS